MCRSQTVQYLIYIDQKKNKKNFDITKDSQQKYLVLFIVQQYCNNMKTEILHVL